MKHDRGTFAGSFSPSASSVARLAIRAGGSAVGAFTKSTHHSQRSNAVSKSLLEAHSLASIPGHTPCKAQAVK